MGLCSLKRILLFKGFGESGWLANSYQSDPDNACGLQVDLCSKSLFQLTSHHFDRLISSVFQPFSFSPFCISEVCQPLGPGDLTVDFYSGWDNQVQLWVFVCFIKWVYFTWFGQIINKYIIKICIKKKYFRGCSPFYTAVLLRGFWKNMTLSFTWGLRGLKVS